MKSICQQCKGNGGYFAKLHPLRGGSQPVEHYVACDVPGCNHGIVDHDEQYRILWGERKKSFEFKLTNGNLITNCLQFADNLNEAIKNALGQHGAGWKVI